ncbi:hypothetical protein D3C85_1651010 [compost metagenome]
MLGTVTAHHLMHNRLIDHITAQVAAAMVGDLHQIAIDQLAQGQVERTATPVKHQHVLAIQAADLAGKVGQTA